MRAIGFLLLIAVPLGVGCTNNATAPATVGAPLITTAAASSLTGTTAVLNGMVNADGRETTAYFQWGTTTSYGNQTASQTVAGGNNLVNVAANLSGLTITTTYHYRLVATNSAGTTDGTDVTFTTTSLMARLSRMTTAESRYPGR